MIDKCKMQISDKVKNIPEALSIYINNIVYSLKREGVNITTLSLGEAFFDIPMMDWSGLSFEKGYHYSESQGIIGLREKIANYYNKRYYANVDPHKEVLISAGSKPLIFMALQTILNPKDEVLIPEPTWLSYPQQVELAGGIPKFIPHGTTIDDYNTLFSEKTKAIIINNPNNPTGMVYTKDELEKLYKMCRSRGIYIIVDEAYSDFLLDSDEFVSIGQVVPDKDGVIIVNSLSKNMGISGWRIGYVISSEEIIYNILKLNQHLITCAPTILLLYIERYFDELLQVTLPQAKAVAEKRERIAKFMDSIGMKPLDGMATFYFFVSIDNYDRTAMDLTLYLLLKYHIAVVPGNAYGSSTERYIRVGIGAESEEILHRALDTIQRVINENEFDENFVKNELKRLNIREL